MINFIVCEDDNRFRKMILDYIYEYIDSMMLNGQIVLQTILCKEVIEYTKKNNSRNIYILDIDLNDEINGLQLAKKIREYDIYGYIIFVTSYIELSLETYRYKIKALDFIVKNTCDIRSRLYEALDVAVEELKMIEEVSQQKKVTIKSGSRNMYVPVDEIICIETSSSNHKLIIYTVNRRIEFYGTLKKFCEELDDNFYQTHRSCVVNTKYIKEISRDRNDMHVMMRNGKKFALSRKYVKELTKYVESSG